MANTNKEKTTPEVVESKAKASKPKSDKPNFFVRTGRKIKKFWKEYASELKKVAWMSWKDVKKNTLLVICSIVAFGVAIGVIDLTFGEIITGFAGLIG